MIAKDKLPKNLKYVADSLLGPNHIICTCGGSMKAFVENRMWEDYRFQNNLEKFIDTHKECLPNYN